MFEKSRRKNVHEGVLVPAQGDQQPLRRGRSDDAAAADRRHCLFTGRGCGRGYPGTNYRENGPARDKRFQSRLSCIYN